MEVSRRVTQRDRMKLIALYPSLPASLFNLASRLNSNADATKSKIGERSPIKNFTVVFSTGPRRYRKYQTVEERMSYRASKKNTLRLPKVLRDELVSIGCLSLKTLILTC